MNDVTTGAPLFNVPVSCPSGLVCATGSAEAVTDDPYNAQAKQFFPLADFGVVNFTGGAVTSRDGLRGGFGPSTLWSSAESIMRPASTILATPSSLEGGSAYSTTWHAAS